MGSFSFYLLVLITIVFLSSLTDRIVRKIRNLPPSPPFCLPIFGHLNYLKQQSVFAHLGEKYGPILLLYFGSRPILLVSSPSAVEECFTKNDIIFADRPRLLFGKHFAFQYNTVFWASYGEFWRNLRKVSTVEIFSRRRTQMYASMRQEEVLTMMQRLARASRASDSPVVDLTSVFFELTLEITMRMVAGKREHLNEDEKLEEARTLREIIKASNMMDTNIPDYIPLLRWTARRGKLLKELEDLQAKREDFMQSLLEERRTVLSKIDDHHEEANKCIIDGFLSLQQNEPKLYTDDIINGTVQMMIVGGSETTAILMEWVLSLLLNHPHVVEKAYQEIRSRIGESNRLINESDLNHLPYLQAIIDETLRLYPSPSILSHHEASKNCTVGGYNIPRGTILVVNLQAIQTHPELWDEPTKFKPERFLNRDKKEFGFKYLPFGYGRRACPAEALAMKLMGLTFGSLIQCFEWGRVSEELLNMKMSEGGEFNMPRFAPLLAKCKIRPEMANHLF